MLTLRQFIRSRQSSAVLSVCIAYALAFQALLASVGIGMSAWVTPDSPGFAICSHTSTGAPTESTGGQEPNSSPGCPFCYVASQCAGHTALTGETLAFPAYTAVSTASIAGLIRHDAIVPQFPRLSGSPRAPPGFAV